MIRFLRKRQAPEAWSGVDSPEFASLFEFSQSLLGLYRPLVLRPESDRGEAFLKTLTRYDERLEKDGPAKTPGLQKDVTMAVESFADDQRKEVDELIEGLGQSLSEILARLGDTVDEADESIVQMNSLERCLKEAQQAPSMEEARKRLSSGIETLANLTSRHAEQQKQLKSVYEEQNRRLRTQLEFARAEGHTDALTKLGNRAAFERQSVFAFEQAKRGKDSSLALLDIDGMKKINDTLGHGVGDAALIGFSTRLKTAVGENAFVARLGGDEFVVILPAPATSLNGMLHRLQQTLASMPISHEGRALPIGVSFGVVGIDGKHEVSKLVEAADKQMYTQKRARKAERNAA